MPKPRVKVVLNCSSLSLANKAQKKLGDVLATKLLDSEPIVPIVFEGQKGWGVIADTFFQIRLEAEQIKTWIAANTTLLNALAGSLVDFHLCPHDDPKRYNCRTDPRAEFVEKVL